MKSSIKSTKYKHIFLSVAVCLVAVNLSAKDTKDEVLLSDLNIDANLTKSSSLTTQTDNFQGVSTISHSMIKSMPSGNGDYVQLLRTNPNVQFSSSNRQSITMGEIDPANISINGAKFYQNNFIVDGVNINNDLDPASSTNSQNVFGPLDIIGGSSQGMAIDSDFIEDINVYDSDVLAKYGSFTGGVVEANTRNPRPGFHGKISMQHSRDSWSKYHIHPEMQEEFENSYLAKNQPEFSKYITRINLEGFVTDDLGLMFGYTNTRSKIPLKAYMSNFGDNDEGKTRVQRRNIDNYFLKAVWFANDRLTITPSVTYAPQKNKYFNPNAKDSFADMKSGGLNLSLKADYDGDFAKINQTLAYNKFESSRDSEHEYYNTWFTSNKKYWSGSMMAFEGGYGDIDQTQKTLSYNLDTEFKEFEFLGATHNINAGLELRYQEADYNIVRGFQDVSQSSPLRNVKCDPNDPFCSEDDAFFRLFGLPTSIINGQYLWKKTFYEGSTSAKMFSYALYLEDVIRYKNLTLRPGVRFSGDDYMDEKTLAPRFSASYDVFGDGDSIVSVGANRYYGRNIFAYKLRDGRDALATTWMRNPAVYSTDWTKLGNGVSSVKFSELKVPYDDELTVGLKQNLGNFEFSAKYVDRKGKDQVVKTRRKDLDLPNLPSYAQNYSVWTNDGKSESQILTFGVKTIDDYEIFGTQNAFELSFQHIDTKTHGITYDDIHFDRLMLEDKKFVMVDGTVKRYSDMEMPDYARPWTARLNVITKVPQYNLTINNFFSYKSSMDALVRQKKPVMYNGVPIDEYKTTRVGSAFTWDIRLGYEYKLKNDVHGFVNLDIYNVLNTKNPATIAGERSTNLLYESGRQFWLEAGLRW